MTTRPLLAATLVAASLLVATPVHAAAPTTTAAVTGHTQVVAHCSTYAQVPRSVVATCADGQERAIVPAWTSWGRHQARGEGTWVAYVCTPDCALGSSERYPATFSLHRVRTAPDGTRVFTRLDVSYLEQGEQRTKSVTLPTTPLP